jgi:hypothetical protein
MKSSVFCRHRGRHRAVKKVNQNATLYMYVGDGMVWLLEGKVCMHLVCRVGHAYLLSVGWKDFTVAVNVNFTPWLR